MHHAFKTWCIVSTNGRFARSVTVVDTISTTVIFYLLPFRGCFGDKIRDIPNIFGNNQILRPDLLRPWWEYSGLSKTAIVIRVETINDYFPWTTRKYRPPCIFRRKPSPGGVEYTPQNSPAETEDCSPVHLSWWTLGHRRRLYSLAAAVPGQATSPGTQSV